VRNDASIVQPMLRDAGETLAVLSAGVASSPERWAPAKYLKIFCGNADQWPFPSRGEWPAKTF